MLKLPKSHKTKAKFLTILLCVYVCLRMCVYIHIHINSVQSKTTFKELGLSTKSS